MVESESEAESDDNSIYQHATKRMKRSTVRKYDEDYLASGFIEKFVSETPRPLCLLCDVLLANSSLFPSKLERHLTKNHPDVAKKPIEYFKQLKSQHKSQGKAMASFTQTQLVGIESSFIIAYEIAKAKKAFRLAEQVIQPCVLKVVSALFGESASKKIESVPLSHQTISRRVSEIATDVKQQLYSRLKQSTHFCLQFDESVDVTNDAILVGFVRYVHEYKIKEDIFCFSSLPDRTTGERIFDAIKTEFERNELDFKNVIGLCTDGASAMTGKNIGLAKRMSEVANENFESSHCILHREALASKDISPVLNATLMTSLQTANHQQR